MIVEDYFVNKMETKDTIYASILALLVIINGYQLIGDREPTHYSEVLESKMYCDRLSSTNKTCYPLPVTRVGKKYSSSNWIEIPFLPEEISKSYEINSLNTSSSSLISCLKRALVVIE